MIPARKYFTRWRLARYRDVDLLTEPIMINGVPCYSQADLDRCEALLSLGGDEWMKKSHGRGRPSLAERAELARAALAQRSSCLNRAGV